MTTDKARAKKIERSIEGVLRWLGFLQQYGLRATFVDKFADEADSDQPDCRLTCGYPYAWANFTWRRQSVDGADETFLEEVAIHEAMHVLLFAPLDAILRRHLSAEGWGDYQKQQERIVDQVAHYLARRRPPYGYHPSGVPHTKNTVKEKTRRSCR